MNQTCRILLEKQVWAHKRCTPMDPHIWLSKSRTTSSNIHTAALWGYLKTCQRRWMIGRSDKRGSGISMLVARHDDDDDDDDDDYTVCEIIRTDGFPLKSKWQKVYTALQNYLHHSVQSQHSWQYLSFFGSSIPLSYNSEVKRPKHSIMKYQTINTTFSSFVSSASFE